MRSKILIGGLGAAVAFLLATSPVVAQAAGFITSGDIVNSTIKSKDVKNDGLKGKDINESTLGTVPSASSLAGAAASSYLDNATVYTYAKTSATSSVDLRIPAAAGGAYDIAYSAYMDGGSGDSGCYMYEQSPSALDTVYFGEEHDETGGATPGFSGSGVATPTAGQFVELHCESDTPWTTFANEPIQVVVTPLDSASNGTLTAVRPGVGTRR